METENSVVRRDKEEQEVTPPNGEFLYCRSHGGIEKHSFSKLRVAQVGTSRVY